MIPDLQLLFVPCLRVHETMERYLGKNYIILYDCVMILDGTFNLYVNTFSCLMTLTSCLMTNAYLHSA